MNEVFERFIEEVSKYFTPPEQARELLTRVLRTNPIIHPRRLKEFICAQEEAYQRRETYKIPHSIRILENELKAYNFGKFLNRKGFSFYRGNKNRRRAG